MIISPGSTEETLGTRWASKPAAAMKKENKGKVAYQNGVLKEKIKGFRLWRGAGWSSGEFGAGACSLTASPSQACGTAVATSVAAAAAVAAWTLLLRPD